MKNIAEKFKEMRSLLGISQRELGYIGKVSNQTIAFYESGERPIRNQTLLKMLEEFQTLRSIKDLIEFKEKYIL